MNAMLLYFAAGLACAPFGGAEDDPTPKPTPTLGRIVAVTVYRGQARVMREVDVPDGEGPIELVVGPLPQRLTVGSFFFEGSDGVRVAAARVAPRKPDEEAARVDRERSAELQKLTTEVDRLHKEAEVGDQDLQFLKQLEAFAGGSAKNLAENGRLDSDAVLAISRFVMESRAARSQAAVDVQSRLREIETARATLNSEKAPRPVGEVFDATLLIHRKGAGGGKVRVGYFVTGAGWTPRYRLRGGADGAPVVVERLASVVQQTGEDWANVALALSSVDSSLIAAPPDLLPLNMRPSSSSATSFAEPRSDDEVSRRIIAELQKPVDMPFPNETPLKDVLKYIKSTTTTAAFPDGLPIFVDPIGLNEADKSETSPVRIDLSRTPLATSMRLFLRTMGLGYVVRGGVLQITSVDSIGAMVGPTRHDRWLEARGYFGGMGGMAGMGRAEGADDQEATPPGEAESAVDLNQASAVEQEEELELAGGRGGAGVAVREAPVVSFAVPDRLDVPSRPGAHTLEISRVELPASYFAKASPVLTSRVFRLARLTNTAGFPLLPGTADVFVDDEFVGRIQVPLVAAGETFVAGFGVDSQLQASRRLVQKSRAIQGGNQILTCEYRLSLRNYRSRPVKIELWDRLPRSSGESTAVSLAKTSVPLSEDADYQRTGKLDNLLRWDVDLPASAVDDQSFDVDYEFRMEYARDLPPPSFESGDPRVLPMDEGNQEGGGFR